ncbi:MAG: hypothetical protein PHI34_07590 [Acidobacteriota bacterium]|nr:hypothetical protein [Acidobacteriota bacterium]
MTTNSISTSIRVRARRHPAAVVSLAVFSLGLMIARPGYGNAGQDPAAGSLRKAYAELQAGMNAWDAAKLGQARDLFLGIVVEGKETGALPALSVGLADLRLAIFHLSRSANTEAERFVAEGESYLGKAMKADPKSGLAAALYGYILGLDIALHPDQAMGLGVESFSALGLGQTLEPDNPRVHLLRGQYLLYVPEEYGGGAAAAIESLDKAVGLFEKEKPGDSWRPDWGKDEAYVALGMALAKTDPTKARSCFEKALAVNPALGLAKSELAKLGK